MLADLYLSQGRTAKAKQLYQRALAIIEKALGSEPAFVADSLNMLAWLYRNQGQYSKAEPLFKRSLAIIEKGLDAEHPGAAMIQKNLSFILWAQGRQSKSSRRSNICNAPTRFVPIIYDLCWRMVLNRKNTTIWQPFRMIRMT